MPDTTPRGYPYPCYTDNTDFPDDLGDLATAVDTDVAAVLTALTTARNRPAGHFTTASQSIPNSAETAITFTGEVLDTGAYGTVPTASLTAPATGLYVVEFEGQFNSGDTGDRFLRLRRLTPSAFTLGMSAREGITIAVQQSASLVTHMTAGDTFGIGAFQDSGGALTINLVSLKVTLVATA